MQDHIFSTESGEGNGEEETEKKEYKRGRTKASTKSGDPKTEEGTENKKRRVEEKKRRMGKGDPEVQGEGVVAKLLARGDPQVQ